jgi:hypothetical protein
MKETESIEEKRNSRRKLLWGIGILSLFPLLKWNFLAKKKDIISCSPASKPNFAKMLTQDGQLVEVDLSKIGSDRQKATNKEMQNWIKR